MKKLFFVLIFLLLPFVSQAATIRAVVDKTQMTLEDILTLTVIINDGKTDVDTSVINDFNIISRSSGSNYQWINGKTIYELKYNFTLVPLKKGKLIIPPLAIKIDGKTLKTQAININVTDKPVVEKDRRDVFVTASISDKTVYEGQQIIYTFALYNAVQIASPSLQTPDFDNFVVKEDIDEINRNAVVGGRQYNVIEKKIILIPTKNGAFNIPPAILNCSVAAKGKRRRSNDPFDTFFNDSFFRRSNMQRKILRTNPLTINVKELPEYKLGFDFSGVVGNVIMHAEVEEKTLKTGDSTTLSITIEGKGNIMDVEEPEVKVPAGFKIYKDSPEEDIKTGRNGYYGKKTFRMALVAVKQGQYELPVIRFSYFDTDYKEYRVLTSGPFNFDITLSEGENTLSKGSDFQNDSQYKRDRILKKKVEYTGHDLLPLKETLDGLNDQKELTFFLFICLLFTPMILTAGIKGVLVFTQRDQKISLLMLKRAETSLKKAENKEISEEEFLSNIYKAFISIVFSKASTAGESLTTAEARDILEKNNFSKEVITDVEQFIDLLESIRFSGEKLNEQLRNEFLEKTKKLIRVIKK